MLQVTHRFLPVFIIAFLIIIPLGSIAQSNASPNNARQYLEERNEVYFSFEKPGEDVLRELFNIVSIDGIQDGQVVAYANPNEYKRFLEFDITYEVLIPPSYVDFDLNMKTWDELRHRDLTESWDFYPTYEAYVELMYRFAEDHPDLVEIINIGPTVMGRDLLFARISPQLDEARPVPQFMYTSTMHGDETAGFILSLRLIHYLISNYGEDEAITELVNSVDIYICPNENPDGTYRHDNSTVAGATRGNINGVDLNRNYPNPVNDPWDDEQPETTAMINFTDHIDFIMSANMHGGIELVNFPFDSWKSWQNKHADHDWWEFVMYEYVDTVHVYSPTGYMTGMGDGVTHGGDWYVVYGSRQDYFNYYRSCREFTLELSNQKLLNPALLPAHWEYNYRSLLNYIGQSTYGVHGLVYDNESGEPLLAEISIPGYDKDNSEVFSMMPLGNYNRPLLEGEYDLRFVASGYPFVDINNVEVVNYHTTRLNIAFGEDISNQVVSVSFDIVGEGEIIPFSGEQLFNEGANLFLSAEAEEMWVFDQWEINGEIFEEEGIVYKLSDDTEVIAHFIPMDMEPSISFFPGELAFGQGVTGNVHDRELRIRNTGNDILEVSAISIDGDDVFYLDEPEKDVFEIDPGGEVIIYVYFKPAEEQEYSANLVVESNDPDQPEAMLALSGVGVLEAAIIHLSTDIIDFGEVELDAVSEETLRITNTGNLSLTLQMPGVAEDDVFSIYADGVTWPLTLEPGEDINLRLVFMPAAQDFFLEELLFVSNAGNQPEYLFIMQGTGVLPTTVNDPKALAWELAVYPNPLQEHSGIRLNMNEVQHVQLAVYDIHGRLLEVIYDGMLGAGQHTLDLSTVYRRMQAGMYFLVVSTERHRETIRMIKQY